MADIHPTAIVDPEAKVAVGVRIGPYCIVGPNVSIGKETLIDSHVVLQGHTRIGERCRIYSHACIGTDPQARKLPKKSYLQIGDDNTIREFVTMNPSMIEDGVTVVGDRNFFMANVHIAHDCHIGNDITMANCATLGGHVIVEDFAVVGGLTAAHQFVRIGRNAMVGGFSKTSMDVPPYSMCHGNPAVLFGINVVGLRRAGFSSEKRRLILRVTKFLFGSGKKLSVAMEEAEKLFAPDEEIKNILNFTKNSKRGVIRFSRRREASAEE